MIHVLVYMYMLCDFLYIYSGFAFVGLDYFIFKTVELYALRYQLSFAAIEGRVSYIVTLSIL